MIIPKSNVKGGQARDDRVQEIIDICLASKMDREQLYMKRKNYFLFGTNMIGEEVKYNRLQAHTDLVASFLFSADHCRYLLSGPRNSAPEIINQITALAKEWNDTFQAAGLAGNYSEAVLWSLVFDSMFIKLGWNDARDELFGKVFPPQDFAVYDESEPDLESQEAFIHTYSLNWDNAVMRLLRAGKGGEIKNLAPKRGRYTEDMPPVLANMLISSTGGPNLAGPLQGKATIDYEPRATYTPNSDNPMVRMHEVWVWDDITEDYAVFAAMENIEGVLSDSRDTIESLRKADKSEARDRYKGQSNIFLEGEHPFIHVCPYPLYNFFWGEAHSDRLIRLQVWTNERLQQIADILERQVDPSRVASGFQGLTDEKLAGMGGPNTWLYDEIPGAKVEELRPPMPEDLFAEYKEIGSIFLDASGLTETTIGKSTQGVRSEKQGRHLAMTGSGRIRKTAVGLEGSLGRLGDVGVKLLQRNSVNRMTTDTGQQLIPALLAETRIKSRVAGHSHSPLFVDETKEEAAGLFKAGVIDGKDLLEMIDPPNLEMLLEHLKLRQAAAARQKALHPEQEEKPKGRSRAA